MIAWSVVAGVNEMYVLATAGEYLDAYHSIDASVEILMRSLRDNPPDTSNDDANADDDEESDDESDESDDDTSEETEDESVLDASVDRQVKANEANLESYPQEQGQCTV